jgi:copper chaperone
VDSFNVDLKEQKVTVIGNVKADDVFQIVSKTGKKTSFWEAETEKKTSDASAATETKIEAPPAVPETEAVVPPASADTAEKTVASATPASITASS